MKYILRAALCLLLATGIGNSSYGQNQLLGTGSFHYLLKPSKFEGSKSHFHLVYDGVPVQLCAETKAIINIANGKITVDFYQFLNNACPIGTIGLVPATPLKGHTIEIVDDRNTLGDPTFVLRLPLKAWSWGINTIPYRVRPPVQTASVPHTTTVTTAPFNLAASFGRTWGFGNLTTRGANNYSFTFAGFSGPLAASGFGLPTNQTNLAISYGFAGIFGRNGLGIILCWGIDTCLGDNSTSWAYQNNGWIGIGINTTILK